MQLSSAGIKTRIPDQIKSIAYIKIVKACLLALKPVILKLLVYRKLVTHSYLVILVSRAQLTLITLNFSNLSYDPDQNLRAL